MNSNSNNIIKSPSLSDEDDIDNELDQVRSNYLHVLNRISEDDKLRDRNDQLQGDLVYLSNAMDSIESESYELTNLLIDLLLTNSNGNLVVTEKQLVSNVPNQSNFDHLAKIIRLVAAKHAICVDDLDRSAKVEQIIRDSDRAIQQSQQEIIYLKNQVSQLQSQLNKQQQQQQQQQQQYEHQYEEENIISNNNQNGNTTHEEGVEEEEEDILTSKQLEEIEQKVIRLSDHFEEKQATTQSQINKLVTNLELVQLEKEMLEKQLIDSTNIQSKLSKERNLLERKLSHWEAIGAELYDSIVMTRRSSQETGIQTTIDIETLPKEILSQIDRMIGDMEQMDRIIKYKTTQYDQLLTLIWNILSLPMTPLFDNLKSIDANRFRDSISFLKDIIYDSLDARENKIILPYIKRIEALQNIITR